MSSRSGAVRRWTMVVMAGLGGIGAAGIRPGPSQQSVTALPECPHAWVFDTLSLPKRTGPWVISGLTNTPNGMETSLSGATTNVPEFHDCQRLLSPTNEYLAMAAVFASYRLDSADHASKNLTPASQALAYVEVFSWGPYPPLGIEPGFNCLFLYQNQGPRARMVPVGMDESRCSMQFDTARPYGKELQVHVGDPQDLQLTKDDLPPVARWDRDLRRNEHYIGVKCGPSWCAVGPEGFSRTPLVRPDPNVGFSDVFRRSVTIPGWFDQQTLAVYSGGQLSSSQVIGTVVPASHLEKLTTGDPSSSLSLDGKWQRAAHIFLRSDPGGYRSKLHLTPAPLPVVLSSEAVTSNVIEMCHGDRSACAVPDNQAQKCEARMGRGRVTWWARITTAQAMEPRIRYLCMMYRGHKELPRIPGTVRWRWSATDEIIWIRCPAGCCEVEEDS